MDGRLAPTPGCEEFEYSRRPPTTTLSLSFLFLFLSRAPTDDLPVVWNSLATIQTRSSFFLSD